MMILKEDDPTVLGTSHSISPPSAAATATNGTTTTTNMNRMMTHRVTSISGSTNGDTEVGYQSHNDVEEEDGAATHYLMSPMTTNDAADRQYLRKSDEYDGQEDEDGVETQQGRRKRRGRWMSLVVLVILVAIIAAIVTPIVVTREQRRKNRNSSVSSNSQNEKDNATTGTTVTSAPTTTVNTTGVTVPSPVVVVNSTRSSSPSMTITTTNTSTTIAPVAAPTTSTLLSETALLQFQSLLQTNLLPTDWSFISTGISTGTIATDTDAFSRAYQHMISSDTYFVNTLSLDLGNTANAVQIPIFQRYILLTLQYGWFPTATTPTTKLINPSTDHCTWPGIVCFTNVTTYINIPVVTDLVWAGASLQGTIPTTLQYLSKTLQKLDLASNALLGSIPDILYTNMTKLQNVYLHENRLTGTLSSTGFRQLSSLTHFFVNANQLTGSLPITLGSNGTTADTATPLKWLNLYNNSFSGTIPLNWNLANLFLLDLGQNQLSGRIPDDWVTDMVDLSILYLNNNRLSGSFPANFGTIGNGRMWLVKVNDNLFTGVIPAGYNPRQMDFSEWYNNDFSSMDPDLCRNIVFVGGEMIALRADCGATCPCEFFCGPDQCYN
jgi:Leucine rich repeat